MPHTKHKDWVKIGVIIALIALIPNSISAAWNLYKDLSEQSKASSLDEPRLSVVYVNPLNLTSGNTYSVRWLEKFQIIFFVAVSHESSIKIKFISFKLSDEGRSNLSPEFLSRTNVVIPDGTEAYVTKSGYVTLDVPVESIFWLLPASTVSQTSIFMGSLLFNVTLVDQRTTQFASQNYQTSVIWTKT